MVLLFLCNTDDIMYFLGYKDWAMTLFIFHIILVRCSKIFSKVTSWYKYWYFSWSYSVDHICFVHRARPVIHLTKEFRVEPKIVDPNNCNENSPWWGVILEKFWPSQPYICDCLTYVHISVCLFYSITATLCLSFTLSNGNKDFKKNISKELFYSCVNIIIFEQNSG